MSAIGLPQLYSTLSPQNITGITGTTLTVPGGYTAPYVILVKNGAPLTPGTDYVASNGTSITLTNAAVAGDEFTVWAFGTFNVANAEMQGKQTIWIPAGAMIGRTTSGAVPGTVESATNKIMLRTMDFADGASALYAQFTVRMPKSWDRGTVTAAFVWTANSTSTNSVLWGIQGVAIGNDETLDTAFGTAQTVVDANTATAYQGHTSVETAAVTIGSTPGAEDLVVFQVYRDPTNGSDTLAATALLLGVTLYYTTNAPNDA